MMPLLITQAKVQVSGQKASRFRVISHFYISKNQLKKGTFEHRSVVRMRQDMWQNGGGKYVVYIAEVEMYRSNIETRQDMRQRV